MNLWTIFGSSAKLSFGASDPEKAERFVEEMEKLPGVKLKHGTWVVPENAITVVSSLADQFDVAVTKANWVQRPAPKATWNEIEAKLRAGGEVREFVYDFLLNYQKDAITFGWGKPGAHFWMSTGSGKTLIGVLTALSATGPIIIVTRGAARAQLAREVERFTLLRPYVLRPRSVMRKKDQTLSQYVASAQGRAVVVAGWESLPERLAEVKALRPTVFLADELHNGKNSKRFDVVHLPDLPTAEPGEDPSAFQLRLDAAIAEETRQIQETKGFIKETEEGRKLFIPVLNVASSGAELARVCRLKYGLTATPIKNRTRDLWAQLDIIEPNAWGNASKWLDRHSDRKPGTYGGFDTSGSSNLDELNERLKSVAFILGYADTHRELPPKRRQSVYVSPEDQCKESSGFASQIKQAAARGPGAMLEVRLAQAASKKRKAVLGLIEDHLRSGHKITVFTGRKKDCDLLGVEAAKLGAAARASVWSAHGGESQETRQRIVDEYMAHPGPCVLVGTGQAFGESLNLHDTDAALFVMLPYTPGQLRQWEGRFSRQGGKKAVVIYYIIAEGTVDERVASVIIDKLPAVEKVINDEELMGVSPVLAGYDPNQTSEQFAKSILDLMEVSDDAIDDDD